jgi:hypothetical protein
VTARRDDDDQAAPRFAAVYLATTITTHYGAVRRALEQARTSVTTSGINPFADALTALDGAVFAMSHADATADSCAQCGGPISGYVDPYDGQTQRWRHTRIPDPVAEFLDADHSGTPSSGTPSSGEQGGATNRTTQGDQA